MEHTYSYRRHGLVFGAALVFFPVLLVHAQPFQLDFDSVQTNVSEMQGGNFILEGGLTPQQTYGAGDDTQVHPLGAPAYCGNGVRENAEECDGTDLGTQTCQDSGFSQGTLLCSSVCTVSTSSCSHGQIEATDSGGGRRNSPTENAAQPSETSVPVPAPGTPPTGTPTQNAQPTAPNPTGALQRTVPRNLTNTVPGESPVAAQPLSGNQAPPESGEATLAAPNTQSPSPVSSAAGAAVLGSVSATQAGILARLGWIARFKNLYGAIPAFT